MDITSTTPPMMKHIPWYVSFVPVIAGLVFLGLIALDVLWFVSGNSHYEDIPLNLIELVFIIIYLLVFSLRQALRYSTRISLGGGC